MCLANKNKILLKYIAIDLKLTWHIVGNVLLVWNEFPANIRRTDDVGNDESAVTPALFDRAVLLEVSDKLNSLRSLFAVFVKISRFATSLLLIEVLFIGYGRFLQGAYAESSMFRWPSSCSKIRLSL